MIIPSSYVILFDVECWVHCYHLIVLLGLKYTDESFKDLFQADYNYYASLNQLLLVMREKARDIFDTWTDLFLKFLLLFVSVVGY